MTASRGDVISARVTIDETGSLASSTNPSNTPNRAVFQIDIHINRRAGARAFDNFSVKGKLLSYSSFHPIYSGYFNSSTKTEALSGVLLVVASGTGSLTGRIDVLNYLNLPARYIAAGDANGLNFYTESRSNIAWYRTVQALVGVNDAIGLQTFNGLRGIERSQISIGKDLEIIAMKF